MINVYIDDEDRMLLRQIGAEMYLDRITGSLVFWQDEHGKLPVRFGTVEKYSHDKFQYTIRHGRLTSVVDGEKVKFVGGISA